MGFPFRLLTTKKSEEGEGENKGAGFGGCCYSRSLVTMSAQGPEELHG